MCPFLLKYLNFRLSFSSLPLFSTCTCTINIQILTSSCFSWKVDRIHRALSTVTSYHCSYLTLKVCSHPLTLVTPLQADMCGYNGVFQPWWHILRRTWQNTQVGPGTGSSRTTWLMEGQHWNHTLKRIKSLTGRAGGQGAQRSHQHQ